MLTVILLLTGCVASPLPTPRAQPPANALAECARLKDPVVGTNPYHYIRYLQDEYHGCAVRHDGVVQLFTTGEDLE